MGIGSWAGGYIHDAFGTYAWLFISSAAIGLMAMVLALTFRAPRAGALARPATVGAR
jgi:predicted MFS family arabinose efflux permease